MPASSRTARLINDRVAYELLLEHGPLTRGRLRELTGLSGPTVSELVQRLEESGVIAPVGESGSERRGPNARLYGIVASRAYVAGVEVRPASVIAVVTDLLGRPVGAAEQAMDRTRPPDQLLHDVISAALTAASLESGELRAVVVGTPGLVDPSSGDVSYVASLPTWHSNLLSGLRERLGVPVLLENEVNLVGLAEHRLGAARGQETFALLSLGDGIGVAIVLHGRLYRGASGGAGELSYLGLGDGRTFQAYAGGPALLEIGRRHGFTTDRLDELITAAASGESPCLDEIADRVALGVQGLCAVVDPGFVVLAGAAGRAGGAALADRVADRLAKLTPLPTTVVATTVDGNPVVRGAVLIALDLLRDETFPVHTS
ncbi:ROK family transcriptional regulator [Flindersiella endophytica]